MLLGLLWVDGRRGSVSALARASGVNFSAAHRELEAMKEVGLALAERRGPALEYRANETHPHAGVLLSLLALPASPAHFVAPTKGDRRPSAEDELVDLVVAAHDSEASALALPGSSGVSGTRSTTAA